MSYFREIPNLRYPSFLQEKGSSLDYVEEKNLFRRTKLRDDLQNNFTFTNLEAAIPGYLQGRRPTSNLQFPRGYYNK